MNFNKTSIKPSELHAHLSHLKNNAETDFDRLNMIIAIDNKDNIELIYDLYSTNRGENGRVSVLLDRNAPHVTSIVDIYKSAYFDECEIYDMFGVIFDKNPNLKRLLMPKGWVGHPMRKDYEQTDERLSWSKM
jgi:NADH-quinone oxidoreductase subunit C